MKPLDYIKTFRTIDGRTLDGCAALVKHPGFSHTVDGHGCWKKHVWIYHKHMGTPLLVGSTTEKVLKTTLGN